MTTAVESVRPTEVAHRYPVRVEIDTGERTWIGRIYAIPVIGLVLKSLILLPHYIVLSALWLAVGFVMLFLWFPVLFNGRYPEWGLHLVGGTLRWTTLVMAYFWGLTDRYPPFSMSG